LFVSDDGVPEPAHSHRELCDVDGADCPLFCGFVPGACTGWHCGFEQVDEFGVELESDGVVAAVLALEQDGAHYLATASATARLAVA
jgi:hypothetical protein